MEKHFVLALAIVLCHFALSSAIDGTATYYTPPYTPSSCFGYDNKGTLIAAASDQIWDNRAACGRNYKVTCTGATNQGVPHPCTGASVVVQIVDYCPAGCRGTIDLSQEAFSTIADLNAGKIEIDYVQV
ncbi:EG45-like domain containing protein [Phalaenopsis equestris]|uniref:EG45-like domain containing protein n=1 Tax=Phalaenopsis equestris TaxID=78828 RepID=UPI0009E49E95|nr:EG45-like domain containing protein [Phalaenopsis equestris]